MGMKKNGASRKQQSSKSSPAIHGADAERPKPGEGGPSLPMDPWSEIFLRVPAEDLVRIKGVCKSWCKLIMSGFFAKSHLDLSSSRPITGLIFDMEYGIDGSSQNGIFYLSFDPDQSGEKPLHCRNFLLNDDFTCKYRDFRVKDYVSRRAERRRSEDLRLLASCDGLLLVSYAEETHYQLLLCNPVTGSCRPLPEFKPRGIQNCLRGDISKLYEWALVRNSEIGRYKLFGLEKFPRSCRRCYVLELNGGSEGRWEDEWKELETPLDPKWSIEASTSAGGKLYWLTTLKNRRCNNHQVSLLSVDIAKEELTALASEESIGSQRHYFAMQGAFYCIRAQNDGLSLWVLESNSDDLMWIECTKVRWIAPSSVPNRNVLVNGETNKLVIGLDGIRSVFDMISKESGRVKFDSKCVLKWSPVKVVPHVNSFIRSG